MPYSLVYRMSYILLIDICKVLATFEELAGVRMGWGKLERLGALVDVGRRRKPWISYRFSPRSC